MLSGSQLLLAAGGNLANGAVGELIFHNRYSYANGNPVNNVTGESGTVETVVVIDEPQTMYNLTVEWVATYLVGAGQWVVHNIDCPRLLKIPEGELGTGRYRVETYLEKITGKLYPVNPNNVPRFWSSRDHLKVIQGLMN